jgi:hypothetical protein
MIKIGNEVDDTLNGAWSLWARRSSEMHFYLKISNLVKFNVADVHDLTAKKIKYTIKIMMMLENIKKPIIIPFVTKKTIHIGALQENLMGQCDSSMYHLPHLLSSDAGHFFPDHASTRRSFMPVSARDGEVEVQGWNSHGVPL